MRQNPMTIKEEKNRVWANAWNPATREEIA